MRTTFLLLLGLAGACTAIAQTTTTLYKSTGPDGRTIYSDKPAPNASDTRTITFRNLPATPLSPQTLAFIEEMKKSADARIAAPPPSDTVLFSAKWCVYCKHAKAHLASKQVDYRELDIETKGGRARLRARRRQERSSPAIREPERARLFRCRL